MTITPSLLTSASDITDVTVYTTASISPGANKDVLVAVAAGDSGGATLPTLAGCGITWTQIADLPFATIGAPTRRLIVFKGRHATPTPGVLTIDFGAGNAQQGCMWHVVQLDGDDTAAPFPQIVTVNTDVAGATLTADLAAFGSPSNGALAFILKSSNAAITGEAGMADLTGLVSQVTPTMGLSVLWRADPDIQQVFTWAGSVKAAAVVIEVKALSALTSAQKATYLKELYAQLGDAQDMLARLLARRKAGKSISTQLARLRAIIASLQAKIDEFLTDTTDISDPITVEETNLTDLLTQIGTVGNPAPVPAALVVGLLNRGGFSTVPQVDGYCPELHWENLQTTEGGPIAAAAQASIEAILANGHPARFRMFSGYLAPQWLKDILGTVTLYYAQNLSNPPENVVKFWDPRLTDYYEDLQTKLAALYDGDIRVIFDCGPATVYSEPFIIQAGYGPNRTAMLAGGYTEAGHKFNIEGHIRAMGAWKQTNIALAFSSLETIEADTTRGHDVPFTYAMMDLLRSLYGQRAILQNNSLRNSYFGNALFAEMEARGGPISIQTSTLNATGMTDLAAVLQFCVDHGYHAVELPSGFGNVLTNAQLTAFDNGLAANA